MEGLASATSRTLYATGAETNVVKELTALDLPGAGGEVVKLLTC